MNLFIASMRFRKDVAELVRASCRSYLILLLAVLVITTGPGCR